MHALLTAEQMRTLERRAMEAGDVTGLQLMERAGEGVVAAILDHWPELAGTAGETAHAQVDVSTENSGSDTGPRRAAVLCGPGNNGGDGFVVARLLATRGWDVVTYLFGAADALRGDAATNFERWVKMGVVRDLVDFAGEGSAELVVDALFGTGLSRAFADNLPRPNNARCVAIDIPSGLCADSGRVLGVAMPADLTVTFHQAKLGHVLAQGPELCGRLVVHDIGLTEHAGLPLVNRNRLPDLRKRVGHKFDHGSALVLSGGPGRTGAARLAARAALRVGAGLVTLGVPPAAQQEVACHVTSEMTRRIPDGAGLREALSDRRLTALCLGPGLGLNDAKADLVVEALAWRRPTVFDADALTHLAQHADLMAALDPACVLTPHGGEFARLFPDLADRLLADATTGPAYSKVDAARDAARRAGCTVLFKGPDTVIAASDGRVSIHGAVYEDAAPWLATAGAGDVLAGLITGLLARGYDPLPACEAGAWIHAEAARRFGPGLIAEDLPGEVPGVLRDLCP